MGKKLEIAKANTEKAMDDLGLDFKEVSDQASTMTLTEGNEFVDALSNKIVLQLITDNLNYQNPITKIFMKDGLDMGSAMEVLENKILEPSDYDKTKIIPDFIAQKVLSEVIKTKGKKIFELNISLAIIKGAFTSYMKFDAFIQNLIAQLDKSVEIYLLDLLTTEIKTGVKNVKALGALSIEDAFGAIIKDVKNWQLPSVDNNLGYANPSDVANVDVTHKNVSTEQDVVFLMNPNTKTDLELKVLANKYHKSFFEITQFGGILITPLADNEVIVLDKRAYLFYWRIKEMATQAFAKPLLIYMAMHVWHVSGLVPWSNGKAFNWTTPTPSVSDEPLTQTETFTLNDEDEPIILSNSSVKQLKELVDEYDIKVKGRSTKANLIKAITDYEKAL